VALDSLVQLPQLDSVDQDDSVAGLDPNTGYIQAMQSADCLSFPSSESEADT
jgi:hypothetical protein